MRKFSTFLLFAILGLGQAMAQDNDSTGYLSVVREGVKWVNEKVIVNHGDTTRYYYNYAIKGEDYQSSYITGKSYSACYYYVGEQLNVERDSLISGLRDKEQGEILCMRNFALEQVWDEDRGMFIFGTYAADGGSHPIYFFSYPMRCIHHYLYCEYIWCDYLGCEEEITAENLIEVDPVTVEGIECSRIAYLDENGEPLAYIVEGIGFDSRDMGDLLTPFTRQPDHDADYQEWCGLSHVVKDGQIIYKGMRYREGAFTSIDEAVADRTSCPLDENYYDLMGRPVGKEVPSTPGIYIHNGKKIVVR